ncbi:hypothetical protein HC928_12300 [bacterium]|nr:hypothetical protein [bacterium]
MNSTSVAGWREFPSVVNEVLIYKFTYWNQSLKTGMRYGNELYTLFQSYSIEDRLKANDVAYEHISKGIQVCITVSKTHYTIWLNLRSLNIPLENFIN